MAVLVRPHGVREGPLTENAVTFLNSLLQNEQEFQMVGFHSFILVLAIIINFLIQWISDVSGLCNQE